MSLVEMQQMSTARTLMPEPDRSRVDSVLDYYTHETASHESSPQRDSTVMHVSDYMSMPTDERQPVNYRPVPQSSTLKSDTNPRQPVLKASITNNRHSDSWQSGVKRYHSLSRIPQRRHQIIKSAAPGEATRHSFYEHDDKSQDIDDFNVMSNSTRSKRDLSMYDKHESDLQIPRSTSMPLKSLINSEKPFRDSVIDTFASLPSRKRHSGASQMRRSVSVSASSTRTYNKDPKVAREEQARRVQAINNAPTGPPPWLDKYQPDPRVPADQQLVPTVARRLAREKSIMADIDIQEPPVHAISVVKGASDAFDLELKSAPKQFDVPSAGIDRFVESDSQTLRPGRLGQDPHSRVNSNSNLAVNPTPNFSRRSTQAPTIANTESTEDSRSKKNLVTDAAQSAQEQANNGHVHSSERGVNEQKPAEQNKQTPKMAPSQINKDRKQDERLVDDNIKAQKKAACCVIM